MENNVTGSKPIISISVISHMQMDLIANLLHDLNKHCQASSLEFILTLNQDETLPDTIGNYGFPIRIIRNKKPQGFAANQNQAFLQATGQFFCVMNPDIRLNDDPFPALLSCLQVSSAGVVAPVVLDEAGELEDSARYFPTPFKILCKAFGKCKDSDYVVKNEPIFPDWVGGMFMLFPNELFRQLKGFNQKFYLYYEDVDLCARLRLLGYEVVLCPKARVIHQARRSSHGDFKYLRWHITSMLCFFCSGVFWQTCWRKLTKRRS
jgi:N-acetylglucosaminyl-diphospho-decaprenol L-rhamnosyltransferase